MNNNKSLTDNEAKEKEETIILNNLKNIINQLLQYIYSIKIDYDNSKKENEIFKKEIKNLQGNIKDLKGENKDLDNNQNFRSNKKTEFMKCSEEINKLNYINKILEKKIKNLETNNELKQMEINSLEEIIQRRNINNSKNCLNNDMNLKKLEEEREKLIKDNIKLIQKNKKLEEIINKDN